MNSGRLSVVCYRQADDWNTRSLLICALTLSTSTSMRASTGSPLWQPGLGNAWRCTGIQDTISKSDVISLFTDKTSIADRPNELLDIVWDLPTTVCERERGMVIPSQTTVVEHLSEDKTKNTDVDDADRPLSIESLRQITNEAGSMRGCKGVCDKSVRKAFFPCSML